MRFSLRSHHVNASPRGLRARTVWYFALVGSNLCLRDLLRKVLRSFRASAAKAV